MDGDGLELEIVFLDEDEHIGPTVPGGPTVQVRLYAH